MKDNSTCSRVLVLTSTFPRWENDPEPAFIFELSRRLSDDFSITVLSPRAPGSPTSEYMNGLRVIRFPYFLNYLEKLAMYGGGILNRLRSNPFNYLLIPFFLFGQLLALIRLLRQERFDLIHAHWLIPQGLIAVIGLILTRQTIPMICTSHGGDLYALRGAIFRHLKRWVMARCQALTVVSGAMKKIVVDMGVVPDKVQVISMGVDLEGLFRPDPKVERISGHLLFVGRLVEVKGLHILLEAMPDVLVKYPDLHLTVAGSGPMEQDLRRLAAEKGIADRVDFLGMITQQRLPELYQKTGLAVFPFARTKSGIEEGFGLVVVEALGCECPVIAGDLPAIHDSISHNESGLLFSDGSPESLADAMIRALDDQDLRCRLGKEGRRRVVKQFDWKIVAEKYAGLYYKMIGNVAQHQRDFVQKNRIISH